MNKKSTRTQVIPGVDWAKEVRKLKPQMNELSDDERDALLNEALAIIHGTAKRPAHASSR